MSPTQTFAQALLQMDGVGRVTAGRLLSHFASYDDLRRFPREQVLTRIKGAPNGEAIVGRLFDEGEMETRLADAAEALERLREQQVEVLTVRDARWPEGLQDLPRGSRPVLLYGYGDPEALSHPTAALLARPPLSEEAFEQGQGLVRHLAPRGVLPVTGAHHGFDVVVHKITSSGPTPSLLVASCGLARLPKPMRPTASAAVRAGGLLLSPFPMAHGPFEHDDRERALVQTALSGAAVFLEPRPETPEWRALEWALEAGRPVFGIPAPETPLPDRVHRLSDPVDFDWVLTAAKPV